ncbi:MAG: hypothetical protein V4795_00500 [Pseudomonadota bacterium]
MACSHTTRQAPTSIERSAGHGPQQLDQAQELGPVQFDAGTVDQAQRQQQLDGPQLGHHNAGAGHRPQ